MIIVDVETTGTDENINAIIDIAAIEFSKTKQNIFNQQCQLKKGAQIKKIAMEINGYTKQEITDKTKPTLKEAIINFHNWTKNIKDKTIIAQNPQFDIKFLQHSFKEFNLDWDLGHRSIDLHTLVFNIMIKNNFPIPTKNGTSNLNSDLIMELVGIPHEPKPHKAINGVIWEAEVFSRLMYGKNLIPRFKKYKIPKFLF